MLTPKEIVFERMLANDAFSQWMGVEVLDVQEGYAKIQMKVRPEMLNGYKILHGGVSFSLADSAFAFASNSRGKISFSISTSINHLEKVLLHDVLIAEATEEYFNAKLGKYKVTIHNQEKVLVAVFNGMVYRTSQDCV